MLAFMFVAAKHNKTWILKTITPEIQRHPTKNLKNEQQYSEEMMKWQDTKSKHKTQNENSNRTPQKTEKI